MLLIEISRGYGRGLAQGIGRYVSEHGPWSIHFAERGLHDRLPSWIRNWRGDGVIARTPRKSDINELLDICRSCGVAVPEELAVLGVDNDPVLCGVSFPPLSSIDTNSERVGYEAAALLDWMMAGEQPIRYKWEDGRRSLPRPLPAGRR